MWKISLGKFRKCLPQRRVCVVQKATLWFSEWLQYKSHILWFKDTNSEQRLHEIILKYWDKEAAFQRAEHLDAVFRILWVFLSRHHDIDMVRFWLQPLNVYWIVYQICVNCTILRSKLQFSQYLGLTSLFILTVLDSIYCLLLFGVSIYWHCIMA